jgi:hypothetical protein
LPRGAPWRPQEGINAARIGGRELQPASQAWVPRVVVADGSAEVALGPLDLALLIEMRFDDPLVQGAPMRAETLSDRRIIGCHLDGTPNPACAESGLRPR